MDRESKIVWLAAFMSYTVADATATFVGVGILGARELNPIILYLINEFGIWSMVVYNVVTFAALFGIGWVAGGKYRDVYVPTYALLMGFAVVVFNMISLLRLTNTVP